MPTWTEAFEVLSAANGTALQKWREGATNPEEVRRTMDAISDFFREYKERGSPDRSEELPEDYDFKVFVPDA